MTDNHTPTSGEDNAFGGSVGEAMPGQHDPRGPSAAQQAAARGMYEDMHATTGGDSRTVPPAPPASADPIQTADDTDIADAETPLPSIDGDATGDAAAASGVPAGDAESPDAQLAAERLLDLQRLQAEYVNYKRRVDRDRALESERAIAGMVESLLPVMDEIHLARQHGELEGGPFAKIAEKLEAILGKYGVSRYGEPGETFDPNVHEAVMHTHAELAPGTTETTVVQIMQPGYRIGERVVRPALVSVADPA